MERLYAVSFQESWNKKFQSMVRVVLADNAKDACDMIYNQYIDRLNHLYDLGYSYNTARLHVKYPFHRHAARLHIERELSKDIDLPEAREICVVLSNNNSSCNPEAIGIITDIYHAGQVIDRMRPHGFRRSSLYERVRQRNSKIQDDAGWSLLVVNDLRTKK